MNRSTSRWAVVSVAAAGILALVLTLSTQGFSAQAATIGQQEAVALAVKYAQTSVRSGRLVGEPTRANATLTTQGAAYKLKDGRPLDPNSRLGRDAGRPAWLVFLRGDITVPQAAPAGQAARPDATYHQMALVLDATTGELLGDTIYPPTAEASAAASLPQAPIPANTAGMSLPNVVKPTEVALPTRVPVGVSVPPAAPPAGAPNATPTPVR